MEKYKKKSLFIILIPSPDFPHFYYMLGGNLGSLLYGDVSATRNIQVKVSNDQVLTGTAGTKLMSSKPKWQITKITYKPDYRERMVACEQFFLENWLTELSIIYTYRKWRIRNRNKLHLFMIHTCEQQGYIKRGYLHVPERSRQ